MNIRCSKIQILQIFVSLISHYQRTYCWPTRKKIIKMLEDRYKTKISFSGLDQHLSDLNTGNYIKSFKRTGQKDDGTLYNLPSNRQLTFKAVSFLMQLGIKIPRWLFAWFKTGRIPTRPGKPQKTIPSRIINKTERRPRASLPENIQEGLEGITNKLDPEFI